MIGFEWEAKKLLWYIFFIYFTLLYFTFYGMMTVAVTPNYHIAAIISSFFYSFWNRFCGFMIPRQVSIPFSGWSAEKKKEKEKGDFTFYGMMTVAVTPNYHIAAIISSFFYSFWNRFCGFMIPRQVSIPFSGWSAETKKEKEKGGGGCDIFLGKVFNFFKMTKLPLLFLVGTSPTLKGLGSDPEPLVATLREWKFDRNRRYY
ncbi:Pleiotropic drug resistance protein 1 [Linum perenne]